ncbi:hypothetical protein AAW14_36360 [Streptomyces hygroscopicus]|uniref:hypothetical protein n=1 Tax=Streptomyces hygroscopicus TaxID=1912 RepID=UPI002240A499|nr:hypothetical protein [Streptomyces hygroscopicus]MCW7947280.1 hypothetical protein [Streptomyces hygroscopicus]
MSVMDKLKQMLTGGGERIGRGHDEAGRPDDVTRRPAGQADKGPNASRGQLKSPRNRDEPPKP